MADMRNGVRAFIGRRLRYAADRVDRPGAPKAMSVRFTFEDRVGIVFREDNRGCLLWYIGDAEYERAHTEAGPVDAHATAWLPQRTDEPPVIRLMTGKREQQRGAGSLVVKIASAEFKAPPSYRVVNEGLSPYGETGEGAGH